jgi:hypothetical protein
MTEMSYDAPDTNGESRKPVVVAGAAVAALALVGAGWFLLHGGGSSSTASSSFVVPHHAATVKKAATVAKTPKSTVPVTNLPAASTVKIGRDPFAALYVLPADPAAGTSTSTTSSSTSATPSPTTTSAASTTDTAANPRYSIVLSKVTTDPGGAKVSTFTIGTTSKTVLPAQRFGKYGELVVLTYVKNSKGAVSGAVLQVGDDNPIEIPIGAKISVQ